MRQSASIRPEGWLSEPYLIALVAVPATFGCNRMVGPDTRTRSPSLALYAREFLGHDILKHPRPLQF